MKHLLSGLFFIALLPAPAASVASVQDPPKPAAPEKEKPAPDKEKAPVKARGRVLTRDGAPVARAEVIYEGPKNGNTVTDSNGAFGLEGPAGAYRIKVKSGGKEHSYQKTIDQGTSLELIFE